ncbi:ADP-dependent glucokinase [Aplysia californica]|uniref:ADP-dependent glucokinase n=1 Tax=Aplysia californica TaxID=6500 RepID=A0ABM0JNY5_APLCA|nr:ADP-dependent glucokinase [Aplysia californica]
MEIQFSKGTVILSICFICVSYLFYTYSEDQDLPDERYVIDSWTKLVNLPPNQFKRLAVGINSNIDVIVSGTELLNTLHISPAKRKDHATINNIGQLQEAFAYFFAKGGAAERPFTDKAEYQRIIQAAETLGHVEHYIGGNAGLMAYTASNLFPDLKILFAGPVGPLLESLMPKTLEIPSSCKIARDEVHLIMEYKVGEKWGDAEASVATRFIATYDESNSKSLMLEPFFESLKAFKPDLILLSGLNILDGQTPEFFQQRLEKLITLSKEVPSTTPIHLELASMANKNFVKEIVEKVVPNVDSLGLNEQELVFSSKALNGPHSDHLDGDSGQPDIHKISDIMLWMLKSYGRSPKSPTARLTRVHFHSLTFHIVAVAEGTWSNVDEAAAAGAQVAGLQACDVAQLQSDIVELKIPRKFHLYSGDVERELDPRSPVMQWQKDGYMFVFSPVLVCKRPVKTVGLGDAISATGLVYSQFSK